MVDAAVRTLAIAAISGITAVAVVGCSSPSSPNNGGPLPSESKTPTALSCGPSWIKQSSFCYPVPSGFRNDQATADTIGSNIVKHNSMATLDRDDFIFVSAQHRPLLAMGPGNDTAYLLHLFDEDSGLADKEANGIIKATTPRIGTVSGYNSAQADFTYDTGRGATIALLYPGDNLVDVQCVWKRQEQAVRTAYRQVLGSLQVVPLTSD
jgi:hypothetical protein